MSSENDLNINKDASANEEAKTTINEVKEEALTATNAKDEEETATVPSQEAPTSKEGEQTNIEDSDEREKQDASSNTKGEVKNNGFEEQPLFEQSIILDGKRSRKPTSRLEISELTPRKKELLIPQGHGKPLGEIEYIKYQITRASTDTLSRMRYICYGRRGNKANIRKNLREFKGFEFERNSEEYQKHISNLIKLKKDQLKSISNILGLPSTGRNTDHAERILNFLIQPIDEGKKIPGKRSIVRTMKKRKQTADTDQESKEEKIENRKDQHRLDYVYRPGKTSSSKRLLDDQYSISVKRRKGTPTKSESKENQDAKVIVDEHHEEIAKVNEDAMITVN